MSDASMDASAATIETTTIETTTSDTATATTASTPDDNAPATVPETPARQYNKHDAKAAQERCNALLRTISGAGAQVDVRGLVQSAFTAALARLLVQAGVIDEHQLEAERLTLVEQGLQDVLVQVEEQRLQAGKPKVQPVHQPLAVARR